ncbi:hypothetical protein DFJ74DRAFT_691992 [Hyaloraphidium curvatum]|nr:hypothetical protein DFJ74DRAFT_691992 [Hyaloraphidium curvatum]
MHRIPIPTMPMATTCPVPLSPGNAPSPSPALVRFSTPTRRPFPPCLPTVAWQRTTSQPRCGSAALTLAAVARSCSRSRERGTPRGRRTSGGAAGAPRRRSWSCARTHQRRRRGSSSGRRGSRWTSSSPLPWTATSCSPTMRRTSSTCTSTWRPSCACDPFRNRARTPAEKGGWTLGAARRAGRRRACRGSYGIPG